MNHDHHHEMIAPTFIHGQRNKHEYKNYCYLFIVSTISAVAEFCIALFLAHSVSAQADAIHALTHLSLYTLGLWVSRQIFIQKMDAHTTHHYREKFLILYVLFVFMGLVWISYTSLMKFFSSEIVVSYYMILSVSMGLCGNIIALSILHKISKIHGNTIHIHTAHQWIHLDAWGDFAFSIIVLITSLTALAIPSLPIRIIDPIISMGAVVWIGTSGLMILQKKTLHHSH